MSLSDKPAIPLIHKPIFFVGFMGCGKTTMGQKIAKKTNLPFIDLDQQIVQFTQQSIAEFFALHGETKFRELESQLLKSVPVDRGSVVATGGGAACFMDNMDWMNQQGVSIYLKLSPKGLVNRLSGKEGTARPLIQGKSPDELLTFITHKLKEREIFYNQAQLVIDIHTMKPNAILDLILTKLQSK